MKWDEEDTDGLYETFRAKMHDVYRKNRKPDAFGNSMTAEFNAWQDYLRNSLNLAVEDRDAVSDHPGVVVDKEKNAWVKILNPSNGSSHSNEMILVPRDLAEKIMVLGQLPESL